MSENGNARVPKLFFPKFECGSIECFVRVNRKLNPKKFGILSFRRLNIFNLNENNEVQVKAVIPAEPIGAAAH